MKSTLRAKQEEFALAISELILWAGQRGIAVSIGDVFRDPRVHGKMGEDKGYGNRNSCHKLKLAADLNLLNDADHVTLHDHWDTLGGAQRIAGDMNHYSFGWQGMR